jgi:hypothetical protein
MSVLPPSDRDRLTVNGIAGPGDMSAVRAAIVAMTAGPPPLPAAGTLVTLDIYQDMVHAFHLSALPEAPPQVAITFLDRLTAWTTALRHLG